MASYFASKGSIAVNSTDCENRWKIIDEKMNGLFVSCASKVTGATAYRMT